MEDSPEDTNLGFLSSAADRTFSLFLFERGCLGDLLTLISYIRTIKLAGRRFEERGSGSQMASQKSKS